MLLRLLRLEGRVYLGGWPGMSTVARARRRRAGVAGRTTFRVRSQPAVELDYEVALEA